MSDQPARIAVINDLVWPDWNPTSESHGVSHGKANELVEALLAEALLQAADAVQSTRDPFPPGVWNGISWAAQELRRMAAELKPDAEPVA